MEGAVRRLAMLHFGVIGLSHVLGALLCVQGGADPEVVERTPWPFAPMDQPGRVLSVFQNPLRADAQSAYFHGGVDIHAEPNSAVHAIAAGRIEVYFDGRYDNVVLTEESGDVWEYRHIVRGSVPESTRRLAESGGTVQVADVLGRSPRWGATGYDHIHLNRRRADGAILDPLDYLLPLGDALAPTVGEILIFPNGGHVPFAADEDGVVTIGGEVDIAVVAMDRCRPADFHQVPVAIEWTVGKIAPRRFAPCAGMLPEPARLPVPRYPMVGVRDTYLLRGPSCSRNPTYTPEGQRFVSLVTHGDESGALDPEGRFDTRQLDDGEHSLRVVAVDHAGNRGERTVTVRVRNDPPMPPPAGEPIPFSSPAADDYRIATAGTTLRHTFRVHNATGRDLELLSVAPSGHSGSVLSWARRTRAGGVFTVEVESPVVDWNGETRTLEFVAESAEERLGLQLRLEATRR